MGSTSEVNKKEVSSSEKKSPIFWQDACDHLMKKDRVMKRLIPQYGVGRLETRNDAFVTLARSIVGQQISVKAAQTVWDRLEQLPPFANGITPQTLHTSSMDDLRAVGLSQRKVHYLQDLSRHFVDGLLQVDAWQAMDDETIIKELSAVKGIGRWTAEMFLIFHMMRPNVLPLDDVGLLSGIGLNYFSGEKVSRSEAREIAAAWDPFRSVATWYIWRSLDPLPVTY